jgi:hypothetical protein
MRQGRASLSFPLMSDYFRVTRTRTYSLLFALPLLVLYEIGAWMISGSARGMRNGADVLLRTLLAAGGVGGTLAFTTVLILAGVVLIAMEQRRRRVKVRGAVLLGMLAESVVYAMLFGLVVGTLTHWLLGGTRLAADGGAVTHLPRTEQVVLSLGAGIYEELLFRVLMVSALLALFSAIGLRRNAASWAAAIVAALLFSAFHYIGPYAYPLELQSFTFRFVAGLAFSGLFLLRGFGIAAWTHALYDVFLVMAGLGG